MQFLSLAADKLSGLMMDIDPLVSAVIWQGLSSTSPSTIKLSDPRLNGDTLSEIGQGDDDGPSGLFLIPVLLSFPVAGGLLISSPCNTSSGGLVYLSSNRSVSPSFPKIWCASKNLKM